MQFILINPVIVVLLMYIIVSSVNAVQVSDVLNAY